MSKLKKLNIILIISFYNITYRLENLEDNFEKKLVLPAADKTLVSWVVKGAIPE